MLQQHNANRIMCYLLSNGDNFLRQQMDIFYDDAWTKTTSFVFKTSIDTDTVHVTICSDLWSLQVSRFPYAKHQ